MKAAIFAYSQQGIATARRIKEGLEDAWTCQLFVPARLARDGCHGLHEDVCMETGRQWKQCQALIYVCATGIAVRAIAPYVQDKAIDPAVVVVDGRGQHAISLLSGHIGGGNRLTRSIADAIGARAIITTATDLNQRFAADSWATEKGFAISSMQIAKEVSAAILEGDLPFMADAPISGSLPGGLVEGSAGDIGILFSARVASPYRRTLRLIPRVLTLGIGCRKGTGASRIENAVQTVLHAHQLDIRAVKSVASIDLKQKETGLIDFCRLHKLPLAFYSAAQLAALPGDFSASAFVQSVTGVDSVCERSALMGGGQLLIKKSAYEGVTVAVAQDAWEVCFG